MVNPDDDSLSIFTTVGDSLVARVQTGDEPSAVVIHPNNTTAFVANRAAATVVEVSGINTDSPVVSRAIEVGSEPTGLALSPTGATLFVAEWAEGRVTALDTTTLAVTATLGAPNNPRAVAVTNDGDTDDSDETLIVTEFFGEPSDDPSCPNGGSEVCDVGRAGRVRLYGLGDLAPQAPIILRPLDSGFAPAGSAAGTPTVMTAPNQLYAAAVQGQKVYVTSVSAAPQPPIRFNTNVFPVLYVGDLGTHTEDRSNVGSANLARLAEDALGDAAGTDRFFLQEIVDLAFADASTAYVVSRAADVIQRVSYDAETGITIGTEAVRQINVSPGCQNPTGIAISPSLQRAYLNCWITRRLGVINLETQAFLGTIQAAPLPAAGSVEDAVRRGARFYFTGRGRWSEEGEGYSSCGSCHPDGLSDNITWSFAAGPRQSTAMDATFSHGPGPQQQRVLNWTAIFDELHDFERNTRGVSGGLGAITTSPTNQCGTVTAEQQVALPADGLGQPVKEVQDTTPGVCTKDWDDITTFVKTIRPPRGPRTLGAQAVARGAALFDVDAGGCVRCHVGPSWTVSRQFWTPSSPVNEALKSMPFTPPTDESFWPIHSVQISTQPAAADTTGGAIGPNEVACVLRSVGTFGLPGDATSTGALERKADGTRAQGRGGFNVPSLWGLAVGAPYLHHGQARTLTQLLSDAKWSDHLKAGNPSFAPDEQQIQDLVSYLLSIDLSTPQREVPPNSDACPTELRVTLNGDNEVPPVETTANGQATVLIDATRSVITVVLAAGGVTDVVGAHIHLAPVGVNGDVIFVLYSAEEGPFTSPLTKTLRAADLSPTAGAQTFEEAVAAILSGGTYINVHTAAHQDGEIRGQVGAIEVHTTLSGDNEVPPVTTEASGRASLGITSSAVTVTLRTEGLVDVLAAHIHLGPPTLNGPVIFPLYDAGQGPFTSPFTRTVTAADLMPAPGAQTFEEAVAAILAGGTYANVHTVAEQDGEIRGQIGPPPAPPTPTPTNTATVTETATAPATPTPTETPTEGETPTPTETAIEATPTETATEGDMPTPTETPAETPTETPTVGDTATPTQTAEVTETATMGEPPTPTPTLEPTGTATSGETPTQTATETPPEGDTPTPTLTPAT
jgi:YVTN family beta-propeller protein